MISTRGNGIGAALQPKQAADVYDVGQQVGQREIGGIDSEINALRESVDRMESMIAGLAQTLMPVVVMEPEPTNPGGHTSAPERTVSAVAQAIRDQRRRVADLASQLGYLTRKIDL